MKPTIVEFRRALTRSLVVILITMILLFAVLISHAEYFKVRIVPKLSYDATHGSAPGPILTSPLYAHNIPRILHHIWFKANATRHVKKKKINGEPIDLKQTCFDINCVGTPGGWKSMHWDEHNIQTLVTWPLIKHLWGKTEGDNPRKLSDIARLAVLWEYGGVYLDSDVACYKPLDMLLESPALRGATFVGAQESAPPSKDALFTNGIAFATARHPFVEWLLLALQMRSLQGADWVATGPLMWGQEIEAFSRAEPTAAEHVKILSSSVLCPMGLRGDLPQGFDIRHAWTMMYYPGTTKVSYMAAFNKYKHAAIYPQCEVLTPSRKIEDALRRDQVSSLKYYRPGIENLVPIEEIRKTLKQ